jgi:copper homeostasis protein CutC
MLKGYRTYLAAGVMVVLAGLKALGYIDEQTYQTLLAVAGAMGLTFLRMAVK